jgi:hypothetical protein
MIRIRKNPHRMPACSLQIWERIRHALTQLRADAYRPEQHYMRGPGPKSRAKRSKP